MQVYKVEVSFSVPNINKWVPVDSILYVAEKTDRIYVKGPGPNLPTLFELKNRSLNLPKGFISWDIFLEAWSLIRLPDENEDDTGELEPTGVQGPYGYQGRQGPYGHQGPQGYEGWQGFQGFQGVLGLQGVQGRIGGIGLRGHQGFQGLQGNDGFQGIQGNEGITGPQGPFGGPQGYQGIQGYQGTNPGPTGLQGNQGRQGNQGVQGVGLQGIQGVQGYQGKQGIQGNFGSTGGFGPQGLQGVPGFRGFIQLEDRKTAGTAAASLVAGIWQARELTTEVMDIGGDCTLSANRFTLLAGTYEFNATVQIYNLSDVHRLRLQNVSDNTTTWLGMNFFGGSFATIQGRFTIGMSKIFELQHRVNSSCSGGISNSWDVEIYAVIQLLRIA